MASIDIRTVVVATDLSAGSDRIVRAAASIATLTGADLHVVHVHVGSAELPEPGSTDAARDEAAFERARSALADQARRAIPAGFEPNSLTVVAGQTPSEMIRRHGDQHRADILVIGPHGGELAEQPFLGTTADRLMRTAGVPCLIVRGDLDFPISHFGVLVDFSAASQSALDTAAAWAESFAGGETAAGTTGGTPRISVAHIAWTQRDADRAQRGMEVRPELDRAIERTTTRSGGAGGVEYVPEMLQPGAASDVVDQWVRSQGLAMVVIGTRGRSRLPQGALGGLAATVARTAPCSVLLVPPGSAPVAVPAGGAERTQLQHVVTAVDFHESSWEAAVWAMRYFAPEADHELVHVVDTRELPAPLRELATARERQRAIARAEAQRRLLELRDLGGCPGAGVHVRSGRPAAEVVRLVAEVDADLVVVGEQGPRRGVGALLGSTAERILFESSIPVLLARRVGDTPPRRLIVAIDSSQVGDRVLDWTALLLDRFPATATVVNVVDRVLLADELLGIPSADALRSMEQGARVAMQAWLDHRIGAAGLPQDRVQARVGLGDPSYEIIAEARRDEADLVVLGSRGDDIARTPLIGRIVNKVVRSAPCSVLVVSPGAHPPLE